MSCATSPTISARNPIAIRVAGRDDIGALVAMGTRFLGSVSLRVDSGTDITASFAYASNTVGLMAFNYDITVEFLA